MRLTAKSEYGLLAMIELACRASQGPVSAREISAGQTIPPRFLEQLLVSLRRAGLVTGVRGARGGFVLARPAEDISVLHVVEALEGPMRMGVCSDERASACGKGQLCAAADVWERAGVAVRSVLSATTLAHVAAEQIRFDEVRVAQEFESGGA